MIAGKPSRTNHLGAVEGGWGSRKKPSDGKKKNQAPEGKGSSSLAA